MANSTTTPKDVYVLTMNYKKNLIKRSFYLHQLIKRNKQLGNVSTVELYEGELNLLNKIYNSLNGESLEKKSNIVDWKDLPNWEELKLQGEVTA